MLVLFYWIANIVTPIVHQFSFRPQHGPPRGRADPDERDHYFGLKFHTIGAWLMPL